MLLRVYTSISFLEQPECLSCKKSQGLLSLKLLVPVCLSGGFGGAQRAAGLAGCVLGADTAKGALGLLTKEGGLGKTTWHGAVPLCHCQGSLGCPFLVQMLMPLA